MFSLGSMAKLMERRARHKDYLSTRSAFEAMSNADLADIGLKRYQLGHIARVQSFK